MAIPSRETIKSLIDQGYTQQAIANLCKVSRQAISYKLLGSRISGPIIKRWKENSEKLVMLLYKSGISKTRIAEYTNYSIAGIIRIIDRHERR